MFAQLHKFQLRATSTSTGPLQADFQRLHWLDLTQAGLMGSAQASTSNTGFMVNVWQSALPQNKFLTFKHAVLPANGLNRL